MPAFLCCSSSTQALPISLEVNVSITRPSVKTAVNASAKDVHTETPAAAKHAYKLQTLLDETLLPGQLPGSPGTAANGRSFDADPKTGVPLLEDTLCSSTNSRYHASALGSHGAALRPGLAELPASPPPIGKLHIPAHLQNSSTTFSADYRDGEQMMSPLSFSEPPRRASSDGDSHPSRGSLPSATRDGPSLESLWRLLEPPLLRSVSRRSGHRRLCRQFPQTAPGRPEALAGAASCSKAAAAAGAAAAPKPGVAAPLSRSSCAALALQLLQQELLTAEALPCCPLLLLPHRVYEQPDVVHVVYDNAGEYTDLHSYLQAQQRLSEASCRSIMRQLLQALSVLHERRWVHRNISTETVWVADADAQPPNTDIQIQDPTPAAGPGSSRPLQPSGRQADALGRGAAPLNPPPPKPECASAGSSVAAFHAEAADATAAAPSSVSGVAPNAAAFGVGNRNPNRDSDSNASNPRRRAAGWVLAGDDDDDPAAPPAPPAAAAPPPERPSCSGSSASTSTSSCCAEPPAARSRQGPQVTQQRKQQQHQQQQQQHLYVKLGGLASAARPAVDPDTGQECLFRDLLGCAYHLAPEAIRGAGYGRPADVWAAGVLLFMLLTGRPPFPGANELDVMTRVLLAASQSTNTAITTTTTTTATTATTATSSSRCCGTSARPPTPPPGQGTRPTTATTTAATVAPPRPSTPVLPAAAAPNPTPTAQLPGQPDPTEPTPVPRRSTAGGGAASCDGAAAAAGGAGEGAGSRQASDGGCVRLSGGGGGGGGGGGQRQVQAQRDPLQEVVVAAATEACASAACREVLGGMLVAEPERRLTAAELLRLPWFLPGPEEEGQ
ncbi:hypothetical protein PLESTB_000432300 [Pleodorina starrii]|uniref:Protein kinase domain-containing protein n=1 Tax=Pleodorina starrii TaxID=330485 RepID=A0A9W6EZZ2_9CHLO|nr:hypothetical protein PLESTM_001691200 [Pleodorina starrii]GLC50790.1 hypothetical protein PLESTB_000432300 [Pleodorina starrii]GLC77391.1 hypothetical protein PLESTF_001928700 [Pleodorina starrii]